MNTRSNISKSKWIAAGLVNTSLFLAVTFGLSGAGLADAGDKRAAAPQRSSGTKMATQKLMRNPWEKAPSKLAVAR